MIVFHSPPRGNLFHYLLDGALAVFPTLDARRLLENFQVLRENRTDTDQVRREALNLGIVNPMAGALQDN